jgi:hypothetical protein
VADARVRGYLGQPGSGKTYSMSVMAVEWAHRHPGLPIYSTYQLNLPAKLENPVYSLDPPGDDWAPVVSIMDAHHGLVLMDEAGHFFDSRAYGKTPLEFTRRLQQVRKWGIELWWTTQHSNFIDNRLRKLTLETYHCGSMARLPFVGGFLLTIRSGMAGSLIGFRYIRRSKERDSYYDTFYVVSAAQYYDFEAARRRKQA